jgi:folate-binding protein YgfZ
VSDGVLLDCEASRADDLIKKLTAHKLRKQAEITKMPLQVFALWGDETNLPRDPRHPGLGYRAHSFNDFIQTDFDAYRRLCIDLTIPNASYDIAWGEDTVADINLEKLNGVSYTKGCYMGQELTSRMHHRALSKKGLYTVTITGEKLPAFTDIVVDGNLIGEMRSSVGDKGLAMLRHEHLKMAETIGLTTN